MAGPAFVAAASDYTRNGGSFGLSTSIVLPKPTGVLSGDLLLAAIFLGEGNNYASMATPSGWSLIANLQVVGGFSNRYRTVFFSRVAGSSEGASYTMPLGSLWSGAGTIACYRAATVDQSGSVIIPAGGPYTIPSLTTPQSNETVVAMHAYDYGDTRQPPAGWTERDFFSGISAGCFAQVEVLDKQQAAAGATGAADITMSTHQVDLASGIAVVSLVGAAASPKGASGCMAPLLCG